MAPPTTLEQQTPPRSNLLLKPTPKKLLKRLFGTSPTESSGRTSGGTLNSNRLVESSSSSSSFKENHHPTSPADVVVHSKSTTRAVNSGGNGGGGVSTPPRDPTTTTTVITTMSWSQEFLGPTSPTTISTAAAAADAATAGSIPTTPTTPAIYNNNSSRSRSGSQVLYDSSPECFGGGLAMKSPGMDIPTPTATTMGYGRRIFHPAPVSTATGDDMMPFANSGTTTFHNTTINNNITTSLVFPHPLRQQQQQQQQTYPEGPSPRKLVVSDDSNPKTRPMASSTGTAVDDDEDAFLPDGYLEAATSTTITAAAAAATINAYSWEQLQVEIEKAKAQLRQDLEEEHEKSLQEALEMHLREHGRQWKIDAELEYKRLRGLIEHEQEQAKNYQGTLAQVQQENMDLQRQVTQVEHQARMEQATKESHLQKLRQQIQALVDEFEDFKKKAPNMADLAALQAEKTDLEQQLIEVQEAALSQSEALEEANVTHMAQVQQLQTQIDSLQDKCKNFETITHELSSLQTRYRNQQTEHDQALATARQSLDELQLETAEKIQTILLAHTKEKETFQLQLDELLSAKDAQGQLKQLEEEMNRLRVEHQEEMVEIMKSHSEQANELQAQLDMKQKAHDEAMESLQLRVTDLKQHVENLQNQTQMQTLVVQDLQGKLDAANSAKTILEHTIDRLQSDLLHLKQSHAKELEEAARNAKQELDKELRELESMLEKGSDTASQIAALEAKVQTDKDEYTRMVRQVREGHNREIDDLLKQLDLIEAEHDTKMKEKSRTLKENETVISELGQQLADAENKLVAARNEKERLSQRIEILEEEVASAQDEIESKAKEIKRLITERAHFAEEQAALREEACAEAREEMIQRAEIQFEELNSTYKKLKHKFDEATAKIVTLENDIEQGNRRVEQIQKEKGMIEADLTEQVVQAKAAAAAADLNAARKVKQYRQELQTAVESRDEVQTRLDQALATSRSIQTALASVVTEKELLLAENKDLKAVSEELLDMVEGRQK